MLSSWRHRTKVLYACNETDSTMDEVCLWTSNPSYGWTLNALHVLLGVYLLYASIAATQGAVHTVNGVILTLIAIIGLFLHSRHIVHLSPMWKLHCAHILIMAFILLVAWTRGTAGKVFGYFLFAIALSMIVYHARILTLRTSANVARKDAPAPPRPDTEPTPYRPPMTSSVGSNRAGPPQERVPSVEAPPEEEAAAPPPPEEEAAAPPPDTERGAPPTDVATDSEERAVEEAKPEAAFTTNRDMRVVQSLTAREVDPLKPPSKTPRPPHPSSISEHRSHRRRTHSSAPRSRSSRRRSSPSRARKTK
jgi:hypothetical protein